MTEQPPTPEQPLDTLELGPVQMSASLHRLATALAKAQGEILAAPKDSTNPHFGSRYADLASIREACRLPLANNGLSVTQVPTNQNGEVTVLTILLHNSGEFIAGSLTMRAQQASPQSIGSCITYARRYALAAMVGVAPDDDDANAASGPQGQGQQRQQQQRPGRKSPAPPAGVRGPGAPAEEAPRPAGPRGPAGAKPAGEPRPAAAGGQQTSDGCDSAVAAAVGAPPAAPAERPAEIAALRPKRLYEAWLANGFPQDELHGWLEARGVKFGGQVDSKTLDMWEAELERRLRVRAEASAQPPAASPATQQQAPVAAATQPPAPAAGEESVIF